MVFSINSVNQGLEPVTLRVMSLVDAEVTLPIALARFERKRLILRPFLFAGDEFADAQK